MSDRIALGVIRKPHGLRGEANVEAWTEFDRFFEITKVTLVSPDEKSTRAATIDSVRLHRDRALIKFSGIESPEDMQQLKDWTIEIAEKDAKQLEEDEYFLHDLAGLHLIDASGADRGEVVEAYEGGGGVLLSVRRNDGKMYDVPFAATICTHIDLKGKTITVDLPEGIDED